MTSIALAFLMAVLALIVAGVRVYRTSYTQVSVPFVPEENPIFLPPEQACLERWGNELAELGFSHEGDLAAIIRQPEGYPPPQRLIHRLWLSADRCTLAVAILRIIDLSGKDDPGGHIRPLFLHMISPDGQGILRTHNTIPRRVGSPSKEDRDQRLPLLNSAAELWRAHSAALAGAVEPIDDPRAFLERLHARTIAAQIRDGALVVDETGLVWPTPREMLVAMLWNNICVTAEARSPLRGALLLAALLAISTLYSLALVRVPVEALGASQLVVFPVLMLGASILFPNAYWGAVLAVALAGAPLWLARPEATFQWSGGSMVFGLVAGVGMTNLRKKKGARSSSFVAPWFIYARMALLGGGLMNAVILYIFLQAPSENKALIQAVRWGGHLVPLVLLVAGPLLLLSSIFFAFARPRTWFQLVQFGGASVVMLSLGAHLGSLRAFDDLVRTNQRGIAVFQALREHHSARGRLPERLGELGVPSETASLFPTQFDYAVVGDASKGEFELSCASPQGRLVWAEFGFFPGAKWVASVHPRSPLRRAPPATSASALAP